MADSFAETTLGRTGIPVHRLGMHTSGAIPVELFESAMERGVNYFYWGWARDAGTFRDNFVQAFRNQARIRDRLVLALWYWPTAHSTTHQMVLKNLQTSYFDVMLISYQHANGAVLDEARRMKDAGIVRAVGITDRILGQWAPFPETIAKSNRGAAELLGVADLDVFQVDFPATVDPVHKTGFWERVPAERPPGIAVDRAAAASFLQYCANCGLDAPLPTHEDCYRFALSNPAVSVCLTSAQKRWQLDRAFAMLEKGPMSEAESAWMRGWRSAVAHYPKRVYG
jgi:hypothetical protein